MVAEIDKEELNRRFEEICRRNACDISINLTKVNSAVSTYSTYEDERTEMFWQFFGFGFRIGEDGNEG